MGRALPQRESFVWEEFLCKVVPDQGPLCFSSGSLCSFQVHLGLWKRCFLVIQELGIFALSFPHHRSPFCTSKHLKTGVFRPSLRHTGGHLSLGGHLRPGRIKDPTQLFLRQTVDERGCFKKKNGSAWVCLRLGHQRSGGFPVPK